MSDAALATKMSTLTIETTSSAPQPEAFDYDAIAVNMVRFQLEYQFSDENLCLDNYLLSRLRRDADFWISFDTVATLSKISSITEDRAVILKAIKSSDMFLLRTDAASGYTTLKRKNYTPPKPRHHKNMRRTAFLYGLAPDDATVKFITALCSPHGKLNAIAFDDGKTVILDSTALIAEDIDTVDRKVAELITENKLETMVDHETMADHETESKLRSCFVVFASQSQCSHFVKARRSEQPRALHQYEYTKWQRKESLHRARGITPLSPSETRTDPMDFYLSGTGGPATWSHADVLRMGVLARRHTADGAKREHFDFDEPTVKDMAIKRMSQPMPMTRNRRQRGRARTKGRQMAKGVQYYGGSKTMSHRDMRQSWRKNGGQGFADWSRSNDAGHVPPSPSPKYFKANRKGNIGIATNVPHFVMVQQKGATKLRHQSPATTPTIASFSVPRNGRGILNRGMSF